MRAKLRTVAAILLVVLVGWIVRSIVEVRTDLSPFLPAGESEAAATLVRELQSGTAGRLLIIAVEKDSPEVLVRISDEMVDRLSGSGLFSAISNGRRRQAEAVETFLFENRYLLWRGLSEDSFTAQALRPKLDGVLTVLSSSAAPVLKRFALADPTGAFLDVAGDWAGEARAATRHGVWFSPDGERALLIAGLAATGLDPDAQAPALDAVRAAFAASNPGGARLLMSGAPVFAVASQDLIKTESSTVSLLAMVLTAAYLLWQYRSLPVLSILAIPFCISVVAASLLVQAVHGYVHGITLAFGLTMIGVAVDYPIHVLSHRVPGEDGAAAVARVWPTIALGVATTLVGFSAILFSGFPGLSQIGLFATTALAVAAATTRWIVPRLVDRDTPTLKPVAPVWLERAERLRACSPLLLTLIAAAVAYLVATGGPALETDIANLSPIAREKRDLDAWLRAQFGAPDIRHVILLRGATPEAVLQTAEALEPKLQALVASGAIRGFEIASHALPSVERQLRRRSQLPSDVALSESLRQAQADLPFSDNAFEPFRRDIAAARTKVPVTVDALRDPLLESRIAPLLFPRDGGWIAPVLLAGVGAPGAIRALVASEATHDVVYVDVKAETNDMVFSYLNEALAWCAVGFAALFAALWIGLHRFRAALEVWWPMAATLVTTTAILAACGVKLSLFHIASLLLTLGLSVDYALFFRLHRGVSERAGRNMQSILNCAATTLLTFGLLAFCQTPVLKGIGLTVTVGVLCALIFSFSLTPRQAGQ